ncbi:MAG: hypothetical protein ACP5KY_00425 [Thermoproteus sp.]|jgi:hypothetical protein
MDLKALAKLISLKAGDSADLDEVLRQYGISLDFGEKVELAHMLAGDFSIVYDIVSDRFILIKARRAEQV